MARNTIEFDDQHDPDYNAFAPLDEEEGPQAGFTSPVSFITYDDEVIELTEDDLWSY